METREIRWHPKLSPNFVFLLPPNVPRIPIDISSRINRCGSREALKYTSTTSSIMKDEIWRSSNRASEVCWYESYWKMFCLTSCLVGLAIGGRSKCNYSQQTQTMSMINWTPYRPWKPTKQLLMNSKFLFPTATLNANFQVICYHFQWRWCK